VKTFLKVLLLLAAAIIAVKLLPLTLLGGCFLAVAVIVALALGLSAVAILIALAVVLAAVLSPIWIPVLALVGVIALFKRLNRAKA
jgi:hypothetical protein